jgi:surfeit locus 1 family protein
MMFSHSAIGIRFTPRLIPTLAALLALGLTLHLGTWQKGRAAEKRLLQADFDQRAAMPSIELSVTRVSNDARYRLASARGEYDANGQLFIDNKSEGSAVGYHVITPLKLAGTNRYVLVNRGFVPRGAMYPSPPLVKVPTGEVVVGGMLVALNQKFLELGNAAPNNSVWQNLTTERYRTATSREVEPLILLAKPTDAGLVAQHEQPDARVEKHVEYMLTWYSLAITVFVLWVVLNLKFSKPVAQT